MSNIKNNEFTLILFVEISNFFCLFYQKKGEITFNLSLIKKFEEIQSFK